MHPRLNGYKVMNIVLETWSTLVNVHGHHHLFYRKVPPVQLDHQVDNISDIFMSTPSLIYEALV